jgi:hypothetical protein
MASSISSAAILRACARRRSSSCRLVVSVFMRDNAVHWFRSTQGHCRRSGTVGSYGSVLRTGTTSPSAALMTALAISMGSNP